MRPLSVGYLLTGSPVGPTLGHVVSPAASLLHGAELPPHQRSVPVQLEAHTLEEA